MEMDELPGSYEETEEIYHWFYGFDPGNNIFQMDMLFDKTLAYYTYWIDAMTEILPDALELNDGIVEIRYNDTDLNVVIDEWYKLPDKKLIHPVNDCGNLFLKKADCEYLDISLDTEYPYL